AARTAAPRPLGRRQGRRPPDRDRPHSTRRRCRRRPCAAHAERRTLRSGATRGRGAAVKRLMVTLAHPQHAGMLRALRILADAAPTYGWELRYAMPSWHALVATIGIPREQVSVVPGLGGWRRSVERLRSPLTIARLCRAARGAHAFYSTTLSTFPHCWYA